MQGRHADRLITVCYLPTTLVMLLVMIHYNHRTNIALRISGGMAGFCLSMIAVPLVSLSFSKRKSNLQGAVDCKSADVITSCQWKGCAA